MMSWVPPPELRTPRFRDPPSRFLLLLALFTERQIRLRQTKATPPMANKTPNKGPKIIHFFEPSRLRLLPEPGSGTLQFKIASRINLAGGKVITRGDVAK